ncbi:MAG: hypothetical protein K2X70_11920 [Candidatus Obscuribacterales bacterium]|jgi:hypothetical protein|nr:hypothetical protein [Candidatus Obscuribacterales bacterium]
MLDIRKPIAWLHIVLGIMLAAYGYTGGAADLRPVGIMPVNVNVVWGIVMFLFGVIMLSIVTLAEVQAKIDSEKSLTETSGES